jgi:hypothetical protein
MTEQSLRISCRQLVLLEDRYVSLLSAQVQVRCVVIIVVHVTYFVEHSHAQLVKKFTLLYRTQTFITMFTTVHHWTLSWASWIQFTPPHPLFLRSIFILSAHHCTVFQWTEGETDVWEKWLTLRNVPSLGDTLSFSIPNFELFGGCTSSTSAYLFVISLVIVVYVTLHSLCWRKVVLTL